MVSRVTELLGIEPDWRVLDLFSGLGNFSLPMAREGASVTAVEGDEGLVARARENTALNGIGSAEFHVADLFEDCRDLPWATVPYDAVLLDPPRSGAREILPVVAGAARVAYVSCHPGTLARDAGILVRDYGYRLDGAGVIDMFPNTAHVESMALFVRD